MIIMIIMIIMIMIMIDTVLQMSNGFFERRIRGGMKRDGAKRG